MLAYKVRPHRTVPSRRDELLRLVDFLATLAEGTRQMVDDVLVNLNLLHLSPRATTVFEALEDQGLVTAAVRLTNGRA